MALVGASEFASLDLQLKLMAVGTPYSGRLYNH